MVCPHHSNLYTPDHARRPICHHFILGHSTSEAMVWAADLRSAGCVALPTCQPVFLVMDHILWPRFGPNNHYYFVKVAELVDLGTNHLVKERNWHKALDKWVGSEVMVGIRYKEEDGGSEGIINQSGSHITFYIWTGIRPFTTVPAKAPSGSCSHK